ncbi:MAG: cobalamin-dependent protein [Deltaproteobacteria bacterium]|nr:cobalamin-dependent protein [Deltaproteobacteria bacterium]
MKISLICTDTVMICYGLRILSSILRKAGHETQLFFLLSDVQEEPLYAEKTLEQLAGMVKDSDLIGVSCMAYTSDRCKQAIRRLKELEIPIIWGGIHATLDPEECLNHVDIVCVGEGEEAMMDLASHMEQKKDWKHIPNLGYMKNGNAVINEVRPLIQDLDSLPFPDYDNESQYILQDQILVPATEYDYARKSFNVTLLLHTTRGCVQKCTYCCNSKIKAIYSGKGKIIRKRSIENCIQEMEYVRPLFPDRKELWITDDSFFIRSTDELKEFGTKFKERIGLPFRCNGTPNSINEEKLDALVTTDLFEVRVGIQTGSERIARDVYKRPISNKRIISASAALNKYKDKMVPAYQLIITNPFEEREDVLATINLVRELPPPFNLVIFNLVFFPGSEIYERAIQEGIISGREDSLYNLDYHDHDQGKHLELKDKNTYLNSLLYLMRGYARESRVGSIPRFLFPVLLNANMINLIEAFPALNSLNLWFFDSIRKTYYRYRKRFPGPSENGQKGTGNSLQDSTESI